MTDEQRMRAIAEEVVDDRTKQIAKEVAREVVSEAFTRIGIDSNDPFEQQKRSQAIARFANAMEKGRLTAWTTLVALAITGMAMAIWQFVVGK